MGVVPEKVRWQLLDFNPSRVRILEEKVTGWKNLRNSQSTISAKKYFKHNIVSHLPYFEKRGREAKGQLLIDDQWVIQTHVRLFQFTTE
jgi:hypothetical protein